MSWFEGYPSNILGNTALACLQVAGVVGILVACVELVSIGPDASISASLGEVFGSMAMVVTVGFVVLCVMLLPALALFRRYDCGGPATVWFLSSVLGLFPGDARFSLGWLVFSSAFTFAFTRQAYSEE